MSVLSSPVLKTKLHRPPITKDLVLRSELIENISLNKHLPLSLVSAPAGYGKSIIISNWIEITNEKYAWLSLDEEHNNLHIFLKYLVAAIRLSYPETLASMDAFLKNVDLPPVKVLAYELINQLDEIPDEFTIVLDDYHAIQEESVHELINNFLEFPPENIHLVVITRIDPPLRVTHLRAYNRIHELRVSDLSFNKTEIAKLYKTLNNTDLKDETVLHILDKTEGWIVGLRLAYLYASEAKDINTVLLKMKGDVRLISNFLFEEVLSKQPPFILQYLLSSAILNRFNAELIEAINTPNNGSRENGEEFIRKIVHANLFLIPLENDFSWFRYHHLFQELLKKQLEVRMEVDDINKLHIRAGKWFESKGLIDEAIRHYIAGNDLGAAAKIIEQQRMEKLEDDKWYELAGWVELIPEEIRLDNPVLLLIEAWICYERSQVDELISLVDRLDVLLQGEEFDEKLLGELYFFHGFFAYFTRESAKSREYLMKALEKLEGTYGYIQGELELMLGIANLRCGKQDSAINGLKSSLSKAPPSDILYHSRLLGGLSFVYMIMGELVKAEDTIRQMRDLAVKMRGEHTLSWATYMLAWTNFQAFNIDQAIENFEIAASKKYIGHSRVSSDALAGLMLTYQIMNRPDEADKTMNLLLDYTKLQGDPECILVAESTKARLALLNDDITQAFNWARTYEQKPDPGMMFFWIECPLMTKVRVFIAEGSAESLAIALNLLNELYQLAETGNFTSCKLEIMVLQSIAYEKSGDSDRAPEVMKTVIDLAAPKGWIRSFIEAEATIVEVLKRLKASYGSHGFIDKILALRSGLQLSKKEGSALGVKKAPGSIIKNGQALSIRELEVLNFVADGFRNKEIANKLFVSEVTIKKHLYNIFKKFGVNNRIHMVQKAKEIGIV